MEDRPWNRLALTLRQAQDERIRLRNHVRFVLAYLGLNLAAALEYRAAFLAQAIGMMLNDVVFLVFWFMYFARFPSVGGYQVRDVGMIYGVAAMSIGLATALFGNSNRLASIVVQGQLDYYLGLPKNTLVHVLVSRSGLAGWGDVLVGLIATLLFGRLEPGWIGLYILVVTASLLVYVSFNIIAGSLSFWIGSAEAAAFQAEQAAITFSLYPGPMFQGWIRIVLFTFIPAGFISHVPVELLRSFDLTLLAGLLAFTALIVVVAVGVFFVGLRRYESGNLITLRG